MILSEYDPKWPEQYLIISNIIQKKLTGIVFRIEHVGSTSVPGMYAKPKIDIDIVIPIGTSFEIVKRKLSELGYFHRGDLGITGREAFGRNGEPELYNETLDTIKHNLYACYEDNVELENHLLFRDYIRTHRDAFETYEKLKLEIANRVDQDYRKYVDTKEKEAKSYVYGVIELAKKEKAGII